MTYISYKTQVLILLYISTTKYNRPFITSEDIINYRINLAKYYANQNIRITLETSKESIEKFNSLFNFEIETTKNEFGYIYSLKNDVDTSLLKEMILNSLDTSNEIEVLMSDNITKSLKKD